MRGNCIHSKDSIYNNKTTC